MKEVDYQNERVDSINETTAMAHETTLLNPRFYTTNFKEMDDLNKCFICNLNREVIIIKKITKIYIF